MNCYAGLAKRIVKSCFPRVVPVPQLQPLDASKIIYASSEEEVWKATLVWAEAKAQEREAALKAAEAAGDDDFSDFGVPAPAWTMDTAETRAPRAGCPALGDGHCRLFLSR